MTTEDVLQLIEKREFKPVYLLVGKEKYFHDQIINNLSHSLFSDASSRSLNRIVLYGSENNLAEVVNASLSYPMLSEYKLVVVREFSKIKMADSETFSKYLENPQKSNILVLSAEELGKSTFFKEVREKAAFVDCKPIPEYKIVSWIKGYAQRQNIQISMEAISMLAEYAGSNLLTIQHELEKVAEFKGDSSEISGDEIIAVTGMSKEYNIFTLQKALAEKNIKRSFLIAKNIMDTGENINLIVSIIYSFFKKALIAAKLRASGTSQSQILKEMRLSDFQFKEVSSSLNNFNVSGLENCIKLLQTADKSIKSSGQDDWITMQSLCYNICRQ
ncbi:MAG: DNA polymerase III subunit delta [Calditrichae bacterium]|nr:DNA polymerase III subunit delta [Calditrichota bacterium]MCB9057533.1 DNA polymerase III subunit delta [Calditrichia bacterium]